jgi:hypothetical protein
MRIAALCALLGAVACSSDPCQEYADYMCDCHPEEDCSDLQTIYGSDKADGDLQETCASDLDAQQQEDGAESYQTTGECASDTGSTGT